jgi:hypothetical protein
MTGYGVLKKPDRSAGLARIEYTIYTFGQPLDRGHAACWQKHGRLRGKHKAIRLARRLYKSGQYQCIEVKSRHYDSRAGRMADKSFRIFGCNKPNPVGLWQRIGLLALCGFTVLLVAALFAIIPIPG